MEKKNGSFSKVRKLVTVLKKCNGKAVVGDSGALISPAAARILMYCGLLAVGIALFLGAYVLEPFVGEFISPKSLAQSVMVALFITTVILAIKDTVTVLYTSDDLALLLPMPFTAGQIVAAKVAVICIFPMGLCFLLLNSICLGYGIRAGAGALFVIGTVLSSILIPVTAIAAAVLLIVIIFRVFGFIRNRDITVAAGGIFAFGLTVAYIFISNSLRGESSGQAAAALRLLSSVSAAFPNIFFMNRFMFEKSISGLFISLAITAAIVALAVLAVRAFYFDTALSMQTTSVKKKAVSQEALRQTKKNNVLGALTGYEAKSARRNPAYMIYGFVMSLVWPVLLIVPLFMSNNGLFRESTGPLGTEYALLAAVTFAIMASCFSCGFNILPGSAFSREGDTFHAIRALPIDYGDYCRSKRNFCMFICSLGSVLYVIILGIVCIVAGLVSVWSSWTLLAGAGVSFLMNLLLIDLMILRDSAKPRLDWDSEVELSRKLGLVNIIGIVFGVIMLMIFIVCMFIIPSLTDTAFMQAAFILAAAMALIVLAAALAVNHFAMKKAARNIAGFGK